jgi:hypothetical protein
MMPKINKIGSKYDIDKAAYYAQLAKDAAAKVHEKTKDSDKETTITAEEYAQIL